MVGEVGAAGFVPTPSVAAGAATLPVRVELCGDSADAFGAAPSRSNWPARRRPLRAHTDPVVATTDPRRRLASATLAISSLPPGTYQVTAILSAVDGTAVKSSRIFTKR